MHIVPARRWRTRTDPWPPPWAGLSPSGGRRQTTTLNDVRNPRIVVSEPTAGDTNWTLDHMVAAPPIPSRGAFRVNVTRRGRRRRPQPCRARPASIKGFVSPGRFTNGIPPWSRRRFGCGTPCRWRARLARLMSFGLRFCDGRLEIGEFVNGDRAPRLYWCAALRPLRPRWLVPVAGLALAALLAPVVGGGGVASAATTIYRLSAGGGQLAGSPPWSPDTPFVSGSALSTYSTSASITLDSSVQNVPAALFQTERWSADDRQPMTYQPAGFKWVVPRAPVLRGDLARSVHKRRASVQRRSQRQPRPHQLRHLRGGGRQ